MKMRIGTALTLAAVLTIVPALLAGHYLNRWGTTAELDAAAERLVKFPNEFGPWKVAREGEPLTKSVREELGIASYVTREYVNRDNGALVNLLIMVGKPGPLLRHPPNICYANRANRQVGDMTTFEVDTTKPSSKFTVIEYEPPTAISSDRFLVVYAMSTGAEWSVPRFPRLEFGAAPKLYKVQMLSPLNLPQDLETGRAALQIFAADFCAAFRTSVVAETENSAPASKPTDTGPAS
jgi:hypothetical protein